MVLTLDLDGQRTEIGFSWEILQSKNQSCWLWALERSQRAGKDVPVIYRHVIEVQPVGIVTIYVGEGDSLNGPQRHCLVHQYSHGGHGSTRVKVINYVKDQRGWTEILRLSKPLIDLGDARQRKFLQGTLISLYYWEHRKLLVKGATVPEFLNDPH